MSNNLVNILGPALPESIANAEFKGWLVERNQQVAFGQAIATIESEKVVFEVPAPASGYVSEFSVKDGDLVVSEQVLGKFTVATTTSATTDVSGAGSVTNATTATTQTTQANNATSQAQAQLAHLSPEQRANLEAVQRGATSMTAATTAAQVATGNSGATVTTATASVATSSSANLASSIHNILATADRDAGNGMPGQLDPASLSPKFRRLVQEHGITSTEVDSYLKNKLPPRVIATEVKQKKLTDVLAPTKTRVPMTNIRKHIAQRLLESKNSTAMLTTFNEVDLGRIVELRKVYGETFQKKHGIRLGFMSFFVKAVSEAMKSFPIISACIEGDDIVYSNTTDISIAVSTERGLVTPVLRSTELKSLAQVEREIADFAKKANDNKLTIYDMTGGNFTITNGGVFGSLFSTPIINPPQSAILGMHAIKKRPVVVDDEIVIRPMMYIALSYDHRLIDGKDSVRFLAKVKDLLEDPTAILLDL